MQEMFLAHVAEVSPGLAGLLRGGGCVLDVWDRAPDGSYDAGKELIIRIDTREAFERIARTERVAELMAMACGATGLTSVRIDGPAGSGLLVFEAGA